MKQNKAIFTVLIGAAYVGFQQFFPAVLQDQILVFMTQAFSVATLIYMFIVKKLRK